MTKAHKLLTGVLVAAVALSAGAAVYRYDTKPKVKPQPSYAQIVSQRNQAQKQLTAEQLSASQAQAQAAKIATEKQAVCTQLTGYRLKNPNCL